MATPTKAPEKRRSGIFRRLGKRLMGTKNNTTKTGLANSKKTNGRDVPISETSSAQSLPTKESPAVLEKAVTSTAKDSKALSQNEQARSTAVDANDPKPSETKAIVTEKDAAPASSHNNLRNASIVATVVVAVGLAALYKLRKH